MAGREGERVKGSRRTATRKDGERARRAYIHIYVYIYTCVSVPALAALSAVLIPAIFN